MHKKAHVHMYCLHMLAFLFCGVYVSSVPYYLLQPPALLFCDSVPNSPVDELGGNLALSRFSLFTVACLSYLLCIILFNLYQLCSLRDFIVFLELFDNFFFYGILGIKFT